jgi:protein-S-isoprenylcysteine O-methyltransferase Ste14
MYIGIGFALGSWFSLALLTITTTATYSYRVLVEERVLLDALGEPYDAFLKGRKRFIPYIV